MAKLPKQFQFTDFSDYGRFIARRIAVALKDTSVTPVQVTSWFIVSGLLAIVCIFYKLHFAAAFFLILKSILDAADGELSREKNTPSYVGRYYDSIADIILNFLFLLSIGYVYHQPLAYIILAFICVQLQGTLYNYYYVIVRNNVSGDVTSRVFEDKAPTAMPGEKQETVDLFFRIFNLLYRVFDKTIYFLDRQAASSRSFTIWFMSCVSIYGLGFQLLIMGLLLVLNLGAYIIPFFIFYTVLLFVFIAVRRLVLR